MIRWCDAMMPTICWCALLCLALLGFAVFCFASCCFVLLCVALSCFVLLCFVLLSFVLLCLGTKNPHKMTPKWSQNDFKMSPKCSQNTPKMLPKCSQHEVLSGGSKSRHFFGHFRPLLGHFWLPLGSFLGAFFDVCSCLFSVLFFLMICWMQKRCATSVRSFWRWYRAEISDMCQKTKDFVFMTEAHLWKAFRGLRPCIILLRIQNRHGHVV